MSFNATIYRVAIASPSDTKEARDAVEKALLDWNVTYATSKRIMLLPWRWETSSVPLLGGHPQQVLNEQGIDSADIVIALFGSRLGSPTPEAVSGTVEEIERALASKTPVHLFFSKAPLPNDVDTRQLDGLREFKSQIQQKGLYKEFSTPAQLNHEIWQAVEYDLTNALIPVPKPDAYVDRQGVLIRVQSHKERVQTGIDSRGNYRYSTERWVEVFNDGDRDALEVTFTAPEGTQYVHFGAPETPIKLQAHTSRKIDVILTFASSEPKLKVSWLENGEQHEEIFDV